MPAPPKAPSARVILALGAGALLLLLAGCGGGSPGEESTAGTGASAASGQEGAAPGAQAQGGTSKPSPGSQAAPGAPGAGGSAAGPGAQGPGQKHGPRIAAPKGPAEQAPTPGQVESATVADMTLQSPAIVAANGNPGTLSPAYTCDGQNSWPAFTWGGVPAGTAELILYAMSVQPVQEQLFAGWAVAGIDPSLGGIEAGKLPKGAVTGTNGFGKAAYSLCPQGAGEIYMFALYALPKSLGLKRGFDAREARHQILDISGNVGLLPAVYSRG